MTYKQDKGSTLKDDILFPVGIDAHVGEAFLDNVNVFTKGSTDVDYGQVMSRDLCYNTTDGIYITSFPGAFDQLSYQQMIYNARVFMDYTNVLYPNTVYFKNSAFPSTIYNVLHTDRSMSGFNNYSTSNVLDVVAKDVISK